MNKKSNKFTIFLFNGSFSISLDNELLELDISTINHILSPLLSDTILESDFIMQQLNLLHRKVTASIQLSFSILIIVTLRVIDHIIHQTIHIHMLDNIIRQTIHIIDNIMQHEMQQEAHIIGDYSKFSHVCL